MSQEIERAEEAHYALKVCSQLLRELLNSDGCRNGIPTEINNIYIRCGLVAAIDLAADVLLGIMEDVNRRAEKSPET